MAAVPTAWGMAIVMLAAIVCTTPARAQDLEPRAYAAAPVGMTFLVVGAGRSSGGVFLDPSVPFEDVRATLGVVTAGAGHTFALLSRTALVTVAVPYARGTASGRVEETTREATRVGWADARAKVSVNLLGGRALAPAEFARAPRAPIVGVSVAVILPTGQYHRDRLVNIGTSRWSFKPEVGGSLPLGRWILDAYAGVWLFGANDRFFPGTALREQDPIAAFQAHASYTLRPRLWLAVNATWYSGGTTRVDGVDKADLQRNTRFGATVSMPLGARQSLKAGYSTGATTRIGGDFDTIALAWQIAWAP